MDCAVNQRLNLSERNCLNLYERYSQLDYRGFQYFAESFFVFDILDFTLYFIPSQRAS